MKEIIKKMLDKMVKQKPQTTIALKSAIAGTGYKTKYTFIGTTGQCFLLALLLNYMIEAFSHASIYQSLLYMLTSPLVFLYNALIIMVTLSISFLFKRRLFALFTISLVWIIVGITDFMVLLFRTTPFTAVDLLLLTSVISIIPHYLSWFHYILISAALIGILFIVITAYKKLPSYNESISYIKTLVFIMMLTLSTFGITHIGSWAGMLSDNFGNLAAAFHQYGLPYCFVNSIINTGIKKPKIYSKEVVSRIVDSIDKGIVINEDDIITAPTSPPYDNDAETETITPIPTMIPVDEIDIPKVAVSRETPNIIMLQLESFFDPLTIMDIEFSRDPVPVFRYLKDNYSHGRLHVPSVGAGTANTEFEVITGMNLDFFGPGEYPYKTILQSTTCESISFNLKLSGYKTHAIHNNIATFYDRHIIFSQLGFDTFTPLEYMYEPEMTPLGWVRDAILTEEIIKAINSTEEPDLIYAISVQGHGSYPTAPVLLEPLIDVVLPLGYSVENYYEMLYYVNQIYEMDQFLGELISYLDQCGEETVLVLYGDHLPNLSLTEDRLTNQSLFQTEYIMWSNFELEPKTEDLEAYQLYSYVFERLNMNNGIIPKLHQTQRGSDFYLEQLKILEYDMLYGDLDCYGGINPFTPTNLVMGTEAILIYSFSAVQSTEDSLYRLTVIGRSFNKYSYICINDEPIKDTQYISRTALSAENIDLKPGDKITISQIGDDSRILGSSKPKYYTP